MKLIKKIKITATLELLSGLHIGDSKENAEIGSVDSPIVRRKDNNQPYIPGSSLKGKMRSLLEIKRGLTEVNNEPIGKLFGFFGNKEISGNPSRIIFRDAYLTDDSAKALYDSEHTDMPYTEVKFENVINRVKGTAEHPRQIERVPAGSKFTFEAIINIMEGTNEADFKALFNEAINLIQLDYLGGSGSRGYGQVLFHNLKFEDAKLD